MVLFCGWVQSYKGQILPYLILTWRDNVFFSNLVPKQSLDKSRVDPCGKMKYKDSLGSRCFLFNDSLTGEVLAEHCHFSLLFAVGCEPAQTCLSDISGQTIMSEISHTASGRKESL